MKRFKTIREVASLWEKERQLYVKQSSLAAYALVVENHILPEFGRKKELKEANVQNFVHKKLQEGLSQKTYRNYYKQVLKQLDIPKLKFHGLRHTFATRCIESQCDYKTVSVLLGHANVSTTLNLYVHPNMDQKRKCIDKMFEHLK